MADIFRGRRLVYGLILFFITLSGFAQMPIFARYHISDIPGLGWLADFYVTHAVHYIMAALLLALGAYVWMDTVLGRKQAPSPEDPGLQGHTGDPGRQGHTTHTKDRRPPVYKGTLTATAWVKVLSLAALVVSGGVLVVKNLSGIYFPHGMIIFLDLVHLMSCMVLLGATLYAKLRKIPWVTV